MNTAVNIQPPDDLLEGFAQLKSDQPDARWVVLRTRSRQEKAVVKDLAAMGAGGFLPLLNRVRYYGSRKAKVELPMFDGYVFMHGRLENAYDVDRLKRIVNILPVPDQDQIDQELLSIYLATCQNAVLDPHAYLKKGVRVEVRSGPFRGLKGVVQNRAKLNRIVLQIEYLNRAMSLEIDGSLLDVID